MKQHDQFTQSAQAAAARARELAARYQHQQVDTAHFLLALLETSANLRAVLAQQLRLDLNAMHQHLDQLLQAAPKSAAAGGQPGVVFITLRVKRVLDVAHVEARELEDDLVAAEHLFLGIVREQGTDVAALLAELQITRERFLAAISAAYTGESLPEATAPSKPPETPTEPGSNFKNFTTLAQDAAARSIEILQRYGHRVADTGHLLLALLEQRGIMPILLEKYLQVKVEPLQERLSRGLQSIQQAPQPGGAQVFITPALQRAVDFADQIRQRMGDQFVTSEHLFLAILTETDTAVARLLATHGLTRARVEAVVTTVRDGRLANDPDAERHFYHELSV
jgi:ATP-dependent Clp protease ATP-binding subunit ClpA